MQKIIQLVSLVSLVFVTSCTTANYVTPEAFGGSLLGSAIGAGGGALWGNLDDDIDPTKAAALFGAIGGGVGLLTGAYMNMNEEKAPYEARVMREPYYNAEVQARQDEISQQRRELEEATKWGAAETAPWNERYLGEDSNLPYQGPSR